MSCIEAKVKLTKEAKATKAAEKAAKKVVTPSSSVESFAAMDKSKKRKAVAAEGEPAAKASKGEGDGTATTVRLSPAAFCAEHAIEVTNVAEVPTPMLHFAEAPFNDRAQQQLLDAYPTPTPTQSISWPVALSGGDLISVAKTGSGKTLAFLLPAFHRIEQEFLESEGARRGGAPAAAPPAYGGPLPAPKVVVLAPTRELAMQISVEAEKFGPAFGCKTATLYGGAPKWEQVKQLRLMGKRGVVVATPGRLNDLLDQQKLTLNATTLVCLDEADRMLDMGFEPQIKSIMEHVTVAKKQVLFFTATWSRAVQTVVSSLFGISSAAKIIFNAADSGKLVANKDITQRIDIVQDVRDKKRRLQDLLSTLHGSDTGGHADGTARKSIVFVATKRLASELADDLWSQKFKVDSIHGDRAQWEREQVIDHFKRSELHILIATDVAARGLDITDVTHVVNFDFPGGSHGIEDYVHRIGRTGRAGKKGEAISFLTRDDVRTHGRQLKAILTDALQADGLSDEFTTIVNSLPARSSKGGGKGRSYGGKGRGGKGGSSSWGGGRGGGKGRRW